MNAQPAEVEDSAHVAHVLRLVDLSVTFRGFERPARVIDDVSFEVATGELVGIVGETGCGKSVLVRALLDLLPSSSTRIEGAVKFDGTDLRKLALRDRRALILAAFNMVFQDPVASLNPFFTIGVQMRELIKHASTRHGKHLSRAQMDERAAAQLRRVQLMDTERILRAYPFQLSGGMNQRVCIAMALLTDPWMIVADEPTTALDVTVQAEILAVFTRLVREEGRSALLITHSMGVVRTVTDRVAVMYAGTVVEEASTSELFNNPRHPYTVALLECVPRLTGQIMAKGIPGTLPNYTDAPTGCRFHPRCPHAMPVCTQSRPPSFTPDGQNHRVACWLYDDR